MQGDENRREVMEIAGDTNLLKYSHRAQWTTYLPAGYLGTSCQLSWQREQATAPVVNVMPMIRMWVCGCVPRVYMYGVCRAQR